MSQELVGRYNCEDLHIITALYCEIIDTVSDRVVEFDREVEWLRNALVMLVFVNLK